MRKALLFLSFVIPAALAAAGTAACSSSKDTTISGAGAPSADGGEGFDAATLAAPEIACGDSIDSIYADPGDVGALPKGAIIRCAHDQDVTAAQLLAQVGPNDAGTPAYAGRAFTSGAHVYRILYRTERGDANDTPGYSSALVLLPDTPRAGRLPVVVASHASRGQAGTCAASRMLPQAAYVNQDLQLLVYPLVGFGYAVIAPDLAGYANYGAKNNPPSAYASVADVGKSTLDGARALRNMVPSSLTEQNVLLGHSQGGHTTFSALFMAASYAPDVAISAVVAYAPLWMSARSYGLIFLEPQNYAFSMSKAGPLSIWYHYTHGELLDGAGHGLDLFQTSAKPTIQSFVDNDCWTAGYPDSGQSIGASANDVFLSSYQNAIESAGLSDNCNGDATCQKWLDRMTADWPHLAGSATKVPTLVLYAKDDATITPDLMACVYRRLSEDQLDYQTCFESEVPGHDGTLATKGDYVADWIAHQTLGEPAPAGTCAPLPTDDAGVPQIPGPDGGAVPCNALMPDK